MVDHAQKVEVEPIGVKGKTGKAVRQKRHKANRVAKIQILQRRSVMHYGVKDKWTESGRSSSTKGLQIFLNVQQTENKHIRSNT